MDDYQNGLLPKAGFSPASGYATWIDYTVRMKNEAGVSEADIDLFTKKYWGFVISRCLKKNLNDELTTNFISIFFDKFFVKKRLMYSRQMGSFHSWFAVVIDHEINSYMRKINSEKKKFEKKVGKITYTEIENIKPEEEPSFDAMAEADIEKDELVKRYGAMLVWEDALESASHEQKLCFLLSLKGYKPAEISQDIGLESVKVSNNISDFKKKLRKKFREFYANGDFENLDLAELKKNAEWARSAIDDASAKYKSGTLS